MPPVVILVRPQLGENIGAVARAMANFGLTELRLVAPRDGWPNPRALEVSSGAGHIVEAASVYPDFNSATADLQLLYATTARPRDMEKRVLTPRQAAEDSPPHTSLSPEGRGGSKIGLVFGPERTGLENSEIAASDVIITIPTSGEHSSLNLAQSVVVVGYEWWSAQARRLTDDSGQMTNASPSSSDLATKADWQSLFTQLESYLDDTNYYRVDHKKPIMWQNLQTMLQRGLWSEQELRSFRGMLRAIWEREKKNR
jgi:tRNA/rRNA methyltransferase